MKNKNKGEKIVIIITAILIVIIAILSVYRFNKIKLLDKAAYKDFYKTLETSAEAFTKQEDLQNYITNWADSNKLKYYLDDNNNIIFKQKSSSKKVKVSPTVIVVNYNYENAIDNKKVLASAAIIAYSDIKNAGKRTVIFVNNKNNDAANYYKLDKKLFSNNSKVIYLDYGKLNYISTNSFNNANQTFKIPTEKTSRTCDTAVKISIGGLKSDCIDTSVNKKANPISLFSTILTRLKSKSTICELSNFHVRNKGNMYPDELEATILLNSYSIDSFTKYLDKRVKAFEKACKDDNPDCYYTYEIEKNINNLSDEVYTKKTFNSLTTLLYTVENGLERFDEDNIIPEGYEEDDIYGIVSPNQLKIVDNTILLEVYSQAVNNKYLNQITEDNVTASKLANCELINYETTPTFSNDNSKLLGTLQRTYFKVSDLWGNGIYFSRDYDTYFTPMSYLRKINNKMDIVHIKENSKSASTITNMLICYLQTKGNFLSL